MEGTVLFVNKENQKNFRECWRILNLPGILFWRGEWGLGREASPAPPAKAKDCGA